MSALQKAASSSTLATLIKRIVLIDYCGSAIDLNAKLEQPEHLKVKVKPIKMSFA